MTSPVIKHNLDKQLCRIYMTIAINTKTGKNVMLVDYVEDIYELLENLGDVVEDVLDDERIDTE